LSLWVVPTHYKQIQKDYKMKHIPHVTLHTNLDKHSASVELGRMVDISFKRGFVRFPKTYDPDPLWGSGFYCDVKGLDHKPTFFHHMTVWYNYDGNHSVFKEPPEDQMGTVVRADTTSEDPSEWTISGKVY